MTPRPKEWHGGRILTVARLEPYKGVDTLVEAIAILKARGIKLSADVVGDGPDRDRVSELVRLWDVSSQLTLHGQVTDSALDAFYDGCDLFVLVSRLKLGAGGHGEGLGVAYLEAAAHAVPVIAGNRGGSVEAVVDGQTGWLIDPGNAKALACKLEEIAGDPSSTMTAGTAGRDWVSRHFSESAYLRNLESLTLEAVGLQP